MLGLGDGRDGATAAGTPAAGHVPVDDVEVVDTVWIPMSDGVRLAAKLWLPSDAARRPAPGVLEFIPYRRRDAVAVRDHVNHAYFAARGYACVRPDMRGHGDSEGLMLDEYSPREQQDALEVIAWIAAQPWCDGNVGMMGLSWGAISALQAAAKRPPALKAVIAVGGSVDRYYDDGGYLVGGYPGQGLGWGGVMFGYCIRPPDPAVVGTDWRDMWLARLEQTPMFAEKWLTHQLRDETWVQGSVCEDYAAIETPVLAVSGWNDCWPNTVIRLLANLDAPCRGISGPWGHVYPHLGGPGPQVGFLQEAMRWWDRWLRGADNGVTDDPAFLGFLIDSHRPDAHPTDRPGRWVAVPRWSDRPVATRTLHLGAGGLSAAPPAAGDTPTVAVNSPVATGLATGEYMPIAGLAELPQDQRADDIRSACFDTAPLDDRLEILGTPCVHLRLASDAPTALVAARLCDVAPDGASTLISFGILNLQLRDGRHAVRPIEPGRFYDVTVRLNDVGHAVAAGRRLRLALSTNLWPMAWPVPDDATLTVDCAASRLALPVLTAAAGRDAGAPFGPPESAAPPPHVVCRPPRASRRVTRDLATGETVFEVAHDGGLMRFTDSGLEYGADNVQRYAVRDGDPLSARIEYRADFAFRRDDWRVRTESRLVVTCDRDHFFLDGRIDAFEGEEAGFGRDWTVKVPRVAY